ncbi:DHA2 family efflux MFS transporter permease subunit [Streptomyces sp. SID8361]|uniref:MFS transporter n=1 Tax=Streptomyces sp. MnatMP-M27 TaxID=1839768 RepID=UPI00081D76E9|nr:MFS transporter [Streptomyces sp. MnatMP-M27]MYU09562.1 DHA2 family efflux MFS transporter permease subunit [Streptomyces sp. SID8361]SCF63071.1 drug resistance transporter, EmrB/QacA subfamily [Streptomyces sp. MnatMP-M27]
MTASTDTAGRSPALDPRRWLALTVISVATLMVVLDASIINIALPKAQAELGISDANRQWAVTAYALAFGGLLLLGGRVVDFVGRKRTFMIGLVGFAVASMVAGVAPDGATLFAGRALQGVFAALLAPAALSLIAVTFTDGRERAKAFGVYGALQGAGGAVGLIAGGVLTEYTNWRWCLFVNAPIALAAALAAIPTVRESRAEGERRYDIPGAVLVTTGLVALVWGFTHAAEEGWSSALTWILLAAGLILLVAFVAVERRTSHPLLPLRVVLDRDRGGAFLASLLIGAGMFGLMLFLTYYLQVNLGYQPLHAGLAFLPFSAGIIAAATFGAPLVPKIGPKRLMASGTTVALIGTLWLVMVKATGGYLPVVLPGMILTGLGLGVFFVALPNIALAGINPSDTGVASAMISTTQQIGGAIGPALLNTLYVSALAGFLADHVGPVTRAVQLDGYVHGYRVAFIASAVAFALALAAITLLIKKHGSSDVPTDTPVHVG